jgi:hypothetical protein
LKGSLGGTYCTPSTSFSVNLLITHNSSTEASVQGLGRALPALISAAHRVCREYLNLCNFICILLNKVHYLLPKPFNQIFNFSQNFWRAAALQPIWMSQHYPQASPRACLVVDNWKSQGCMQLKEYAKHTLLNKTS